MGNRVLVIGLDGAEPGCLFPWAQKGRLPNMGKLMQRGAWGLAESTMPPFTPLAWPSFYTGVNPGKHGVFSFFEDLRERERKPVTGSSVRAKPIWRTLNEHNKRTIVMAVPITYPPEQLDGVMISGMDTPDENCDFTHPQDLKRKLLDQGYTIFPDQKLMYSGDREALYKEALRITQLKAKVFTNLLVTQQWDFAMVVLNEIDVISHFLCDRRYEFYAETDKLLGQLLSVIDLQETMVLVVSDHGVQPFKACIYVNQILSDLGLLRVRPEKHTELARRVRQLGFTRGRVRRVAERLGIARWLRHIPGPVATMIPAETSGLLDVDMSQTKLYFDGGYWAHLTNGLMPSTAELGKLREILSRYNCQMVHKSEVYHGPYMSHAPDYILYSDDHFFSSRLGTGQWVGPLEKRPGEHTPNGVAILAGDASQISGGQIASKLIDWVPTLLYLMDIPIPSTVDGRVLSSALQPSLLKERPILGTPLRRREGLRERIQQLKDQNRI